MSDKRVLTPPVEVERLAMALYAEKMSLHVGAPLASAVTVRRAWKQARIEVQQRCRAEARRVLAVVTCLAVKRTTGRARP